LIFLKQLKHYISY